MAFGILLKTFCPNMTNWPFIFHIWVFEFHTLNFVLLIRIHHYIPRDDVAWHMDTYWLLWWPLYKLQLDNNDMDFMMRWQCQVVFLVASSSFLMVYLIYASSSWKTHFVHRFNPPSSIEWNLETSQSIYNALFMSLSMIYFMPLWYVSFVLLLRSCLFILSPCYLLLIIVLLW